MRRAAGFAVLGMGAIHVACSQLLDIPDRRFVTLDSGAEDAAEDALEAQDATAVTDGPVNDAGPPPECTTNAECTAKLTKLGPIEAGPDAAPDAGPIGVLDGGTVPAMCRQGKCARLLTEDCNSVLGDYNNDNAILLATLFSTTGSQSKTNIARQQSALMAAEEVNSSLGGGGIPPAHPTGPTRPLVVLSCDELTNLDRVSTHLVNDLHVPGVVGPNLSQDTLDLTVKYSVAGGMALMTPAAVASAISGLADNNLTWRDIPSDAQRAKLLINQIGAVEGPLHTARGATLKLALVYRDDALGQSTFGSISGDLTFNGKAISDAANGAVVKIHKYSPASVPSQTAIATALIAFRPDVVAVFGTAESITNVVLPFEKGVEAVDPAGLIRPSYVLIDSNKVKELTDGLSAAGVPASLRGRVRGTGVTPEAASVPVFGAFNTGFSARYTDNPRVSAMGTSYDAMYAFAYALAATTSEPVSGTSIAHGLAKLGSGQEIQVGRTTILTAFQKLSAGTPVDPIGTFGHLRWDKNGDILGGIIEIWCIGETAGVPYFASSGLTMDVPTQTLSGAYTQCP